MVSSCTDVLLAIANSAAEEVGVLPALASSAAEEVSVLARNFFLYFAHQ